MIIIYHGFQNFFLNKAKKQFLLVNCKDRCEKSPRSRSNNSNEGEEHQGK